jgi:hypothetical protein
LTFLTTQNEEVLAEVDISRDEYLTLLRSAEKLNQSIEDYLISFLKKYFESELGSLVEDYGL